MMRCSGLPGGNDDSAKPANKSNNPDTANTMLLQRVLTAIPLAILAVWAILYQSTNVLMIAFLVITLIAGWEWAQLAGIHARVWRAVLAVVLTLTVYIAYRYILHTVWLHYLLMLAVTWWCLVMLRMSAKPPAPASEKDRKSVV